MPFVIICQSVWRNIELKPRFDPPYFPGSEKSSYEQLPDQTTAAGCWSFFCDRWYPVWGCYATILYIYIWCGTIVLSDCWHDVLFLLVKLRHIANQHGNRTSSDFLVEKKPRSGNAWNWQRFIWKWGIPYTPKIHEVGKYVRKDCNRFLDVWEDWADHTGKFMQFLEDGDKQVDGDFSLNVWEGWVCKSLLLAILTITKLNSSLIVERTGANHTGKFNNTED